MININKLYETIKKYVKENYLFILGFFCLLFLFNIRFPYYIEAPGGLVNLKNKIEINNNYSETGNFSMAYVSEYKATIPMLIYAYFDNAWDVLKKEEVAISDETYEEISFRDKLYLEESKQDAIIYAFKSANKKYEISNRKVFITYIEKQAESDLKIGDEIISINDIIISTKEDLDNIIKSSNVGTKLEIKVKNKNKEYNRYAFLRSEEGRKIIGVLVNEQKDLTTDPAVKFHFDGNESGPSGGLLMSLAIYNSLTDYDITKNRNIAGTGTIDVFGNVGAIGGIKYKIIGASKENVDIFLVPSANYKEAKQVAEKEKLDITLVSVSTFEEALEYLKAN